MFHSLVKAGEGLWSGSTLRRHAGDTGNMVDRSLSLSLGLKDCQGDPHMAGRPHTAGRPPGAEEEAKTMST